MIIAHTLGTGGPDLELLMLAGAMLVLGAILFFQKSAKPIVSLTLVLLSLALGTGAFALGGDDGSTSAAPSGVQISIESPTNGESIPADEPVELMIDLEGATVFYGSSSDDPTQGHLHIFIDGKIASMPGILTPKISVPEGTHTLTVEFVAADHSQFSPRITAGVEVRAE